MSSEHCRGLTAIACVLVSAAALGQNLPGASAWGDRERVLAHFERAAETDLKELYLLCDRVSRRRLLAQDEAAYCLIAADVLKARSFAGDFDALLAWWRLHRDEWPEEPSQGSVQRSLPR